jgi:hypothetical protein
VNLLIALLAMYTPQRVKKQALLDLFQATAAAFESDVPSLTGLAPDECLSQYALFTQHHTENLIRNGHDLDGVQQRLYQRARELGAVQRRHFRIHTVTDVMAMGRALYRILGIDFRGDARGQVVVTRCYFSRFYSSQSCRIMSAMDRGLFDGLSGGGQLQFSARITDGQAHCRARFAP